MGLAQQVQQLWLQGVGGTGVRITKYPVDAAGVALTASGMTTGAYKFAAAGANVAEIVAKATITENYRVVGVALDTPSAASIFVVRIGTGAAAAAAMTVVLFELGLEVATDAGGYVSMLLPFVATTVADGLTDAILGDLASSAAGADDTANATVFVATGAGT